MGTRTHTIIPDEELAGRRLLDLVEFDATRDQLLGLFRHHTVAKALEGSGYVTYKTPESKNGPVIYLENVGQPAASFQRSYVVRASIPTACDIGEYVASLRSSKTKLFGDLRNCGIKYALMEDAYEVLPVDVMQDESKEWKVIEDGLKRDLK